MKKQEVIDTILQLEEKYFDLVWYARKSPEHFDIPKVKENMDRIDNLYPTEVEGLYGEHSDWNHGFNSGMLAGLRYVIALYESGKERADDEFPFLDT